MSHVSDFFRPRDSSSTRLASSDTGVFAKVSRDQIPQTLVWDITYKCNLKCIHCYNGEKYGYEDEAPKGNNTILSFDQACNVVDLAKARGIVHIHMLGGEPLSRRDLPNIIRYATKQSIAVTLTTNGTLISESIAKDIIEAGTEQVSVSLDGASPATNDAIRGAGTYNRILNGLELLCDARRQFRPEFQIGLTFTLTSLTLGELPQIVELAKHLDLDVVVLEDILDLGLAVRRPELFYSHEEKVEAFEKLARHISENPVRGLRPVVQIDTHYIVSRYLDRKYRPAFVTPQRNPVCPGATNLIYMDTNGYVHACGIGPNLDFATTQAAKHDSQFVHISSVRSLKEVNFSDFLDKREKVSFEQAPCPTCDYRGDCLPCHFVMQSEQPAKAFDICKYVFKKEAEFERPILNGCAMITKPSLIIRGLNECLVQHHRTGNQFRVGGSGKYLLGLIPESPSSISVSSLLDSICQKYSMVPSRNVKRDIVDFVWWLHLLGVLTIVPGGGFSDQDSERSLALETPATVCA